ncbi:MAG: ABC transporter permease [Planctomycetes bacterium]|nr:ABC transporter permease [Planctomycetota bacterium]
MTIRELGYRRAVYEPVPRWRRWLPLARQEFAHLFRSRAGVAVFCACLLPFVVRIFILMVRSGVVNFVGMRERMLTRSQLFAQWDPTRPDFYAEAVLQTFPGLPLLVLLSATVTAGAIARDRATNALELLWTRGISPIDYLGAKLLGAWALLATLTVAGPFVLWIVAVLVADDWSFATATAPFMPQLLLGLMLVTAAWTAICVLISCLSQTPSQAIVTWCIVMIGSSAVANVTAVVFREPAMRSWASVWDAGGVVGRWFAAVSTRGAPVVPATLVLGGLVVGLALLARKRLSVGEAVG